MPVPRLQPSPCVGGEAAGLDLFIGEEAYVHRGLGAPTLTPFLREFTFIDPDVPSCVVLPEPENNIAIRAYEKAGFRHVKTIQVPGEPTRRYAMRIGPRAASGEVAQILTTPTV